jgi:hypothetical protein
MIICGIYFIGLVVAFIALMLIKVIDAHNEHKAFTVGDAFESLAYSIFSWAIVLFIIIIIAMHIYYKIQDKPLFKFKK